MNKMSNRPKNGSAISRSNNNQEVEIDSDKFVKSRKSKNNVEVEFITKNFDYDDEDNNYDSSDYSSDNDSDNNVPKVSRDVKINDRRDRQNILTIIIISVIVIILLMLGSWTFLPSSSDYNHAIDLMKSRFPNISPNSWKMLNISLYSQIFRLSSIQKPAVVILIGTKQKIDEFRKELVRLVLHRCPSYHIRKDLQLPDDLKLDLIEFLNRNSQYHCAYLAEIDMIPAALGSLLQGLTDELNAKHKQMIYLFSLCIDENVRNTQLLSSEADKNAEVLVVNRLRSVWQEEMGEERFVALHTRLVVNVLTVI